MPSAVTTKRALPWYKRGPHGTPIRRRCLLRWGGVGGIAATPRAALPPIPNRRHRRANLPWRTFLGLNPLRTNDRDETNADHARGRAGIGSSARRRLLPAH